MRESRCAMGLIALGAVLWLAGGAVSQSCTGTVSASADGGACFCDHSSYCDVSCCCDADCRTTDRLLFTLCSDQYNLNSSCTCLSSTPMMYNASLLIGGQQSFAVAGTSCLFQGTYASLLSARNYYQSPVPQCTLLTSANSTVWMSSVVSLRNTFYNATYTSGQPLLVAYYSGSSGSDVVGYLPLPKPVSFFANTATAVCADDNAVAFLRNERWTCYRYVNDIPTMCTTLSALKTTAYYQNMNVIANPRLGIWVMSVDSVYQSLQQLQLSGTSLFASLSIATSVALSVSGSCVTNSGTAPSPTLSTVAGQQVCDCVVSSVTYAVVLDSSNTITSITANIVTSSFSSSPLQQTFAVSFNQNGVTSTAKSGSPGYVLGLPVLGLYTNSLYSTSNWVYSTNCVTSYTSNTVCPLRVLAATAGADCSACLQNTSACVQSVQFGLNYQSGCTFTVTTANFATVCSAIQSQAAYMLAALPYPTGGTVSNLQSQLPSFAIYGVASTALDATNWVTPVVYQPTASSNSDYRNGTYVCTNVIRTLAIEILYVNTGSLASPAPAITAIGYRFGPAERVVLSFTSGQSSQLLELKTIVKFVNASSLNVVQKAGLSNYSPDGVRSWSDFFYLFYQTLTYLWSVSSSAFLPSSITSYT